MKFLLCFILAFSLLGAKEPTNWFFGAGVGAGNASIEKNYGEAGTNKLGISWANWTDYSTEIIKDWGVTWEILAGYKHFLNDYFGFRYYGNLGMQHYEDVLYSAGNSKGFMLDYTVNIDTLINFYTAETWSLGMFAGVGVGGTYVNSKAFGVYEAMYKDRVPNSTDTIYLGEGKTYKNHWSAVFNLGLRASYFQKIKNVKSSVCDDREGGRRVCRGGINYYEHSVEFTARFPVLNYEITDGFDILGAYSNNTAQGIQGQYVAIYKRPGYILKNPYKFTIRYIFAF